MEEFLKDMNKEYPPPTLQAVDLYCWSSSDTLGIILSFDRASFVPHYLKRIKTWADKVEGRIFELMAYGDKERKEFKERFIMTSDIKFFGDYDLALAIKSITIRVNATLGRKHPRYEASLKVTFKNEKQFVHEYAKNISKGGIFVATEKPLPVRSRVELVFSLPNSPTPVKVIGEVVHVVAPETAKLMNGGKWPGMGIQFVEYEENGAKILEEYLRALNPS